MKHIKTFEDSFSSKELYEKFYLLKDKFVIIKTQTDIFYKAKIKQIEITFNDDFYLEIEYYDYNYELNGYDTVIISYTEHEITKLMNKGFDIIYSTDDFTDLKNKYILLSKSKKYNL